MFVLELFAGTRSIGKAFEKKGHKVFSVDWDKSFPDIDLYEDISKLSASWLAFLMGRYPDVVWASPDCTTYSVAGIGKHRRPGSDKQLEPMTEYAWFCDGLNQHVLALIRDLHPGYWFIENPRGGYEQ